MLIYKITNLINKKCYIGATTTSLAIRKRNHIWTSRAEDYPICKAIRKYGEDNFSFQVIEIEPNKETMHKREQYYIALYDSMNNGYNGTSGGLDCVYSKETKKKLSIVNGNENHKRSKETKKKMSISQRERRKRERSDYANRYKIF